MSQLPSFLRRGENFSELNVSGMNDKNGGWIQYDDIR
jgi:hypothetical protein